MPIRDKLESARVGSVEEAPSVISRSAGTRHFVSLHHHSTFSFLDGYGLPEEHVERAAELDMPALALTEHGNISSHVRLEERGLELGVKPIFGCEFYCGGVNDPEWNGGGPATQLKNHLTVLAENEIGYRNLLKLTTLAWARGFHYFPTVSGKMLSAHKEGLIVLSGCTGSALATALVGGKLVDVNDASYARAKRVASAFLRLLGPDHFFLEVQAFPELDNVRSINQAYSRLSQELGLGVVATADCHYPRPEDNELQRILHNVRGGGRQSLEEQSQQWEYDILLTPPPNDRVIYNKLRGTGLSKVKALESIERTSEIAERCSVELPKMSLLRFPLPNEYSSANEVCTQWLKDGWYYRGFDKRSSEYQEEARTRIRYEMSIIREKDYTDYFLIVSDIVRNAKDTGVVVGPARGSAAASLVAYLLRITEVNPIEFPSLVFERFIDVTRKDLPDVDLDFDPHRRHEIWQYAEAKYGPEHVGTIGNFIGYKAKNSLDDVARACRIPQWEVDKVKDLLVERSSGDLRASATIEDTVGMFEEADAVFQEHPELWAATRLEGNYKGLGVHAAGLVVAPEPITKVCAFYEREVAGERRRVVSMDKYDAEKMGLLKIDVLGLTTLAAIREAIAMLGMDLQDLYDMGLDDPEVYRGFQESDLVGIFQFQGWSTRTANESVKPSNFAEVAVVSALSRPGPLHSGAVHQYVDAKQGRSKPESLHPILDDITKDTYGQVVYQEQILRIVKEIGQFDWTHSAYIRRIISKKIGEQEFNRQWERFKKGAMNQGIEEDVALKIWKYCITAGSYAFCLTGDAKVKTGSANQHHNGIYSLHELWKAYNSNTPLGTKLRCGQDGKRIKLQQMDDDGMIRPAPFYSIDRSPFPQPIYNVSLENGFEFKASMVHRVLTTYGYKEVGVELTVGDELVVQDIGYKYQQPYRPHAQLTASVGLEVCRRSGNSCEHCGETEGRIEYAHVVSLTDMGGNLGKYHNVNNVLHLCNPCHKRFDYKNGSRKKRDTRGKPTAVSKVVSIEEMDTPEYVYMIEMGDDNHNYIGNGVVHHNNNAHCVSYGMIGYWCMWLKRHHPLEFYCSWLKAGEGDMATLLRDASKKGIGVLPPDPLLSTEGWSRDVERNALRAGLTAVPGIGVKTSRGIVEERLRATRDGTPWVGWASALSVKGVGPKTIEKCQEFSEADDPFDIEILTKKFAEIKDWLSLGPRVGGRVLPAITHSALDIPASKGNDTPIVWAGIAHDRNLRDIYEVNFSKTGEALDREKIRDPELNEYMLVLGEDDQELVRLKFDRWRYPKFRKAIWDIELERDIVLVRGYKPGFLGFRMIHVQEMWVLQPD